MWPLTCIRRNAGNLSTQGEDPVIVAADMNLDRYISNVVTSLVEAVCFFVNLELRL